LAHFNSDSCTADDWYNNTPLILAAINGNVEVVRVLLDGGADVQRVSDKRYSALHQAAMNGHLEVCRLLLDRGAKVDAVGGQYKFTALHEAAIHGHLSVAKLLVERGADVRVKDVYGNTVAFTARSNGHTDVADWLDSVSRV
jgi:ankyrin repeat protein